MDALDWILVAIRWTHAIAAVAWVGGSIFYLLALRPGLRRSPGAGAGMEEAESSVAREFRVLVNTAISVLLISGVVLTLSRLTSDAASPAYIGVLAGKIALAMYMFFAVWLMQRRSSAARDEGDAAGGTLARWRKRLTGPGAVLVSGVVVFGLADVLDALFERGLVG